MGLEDIPLAVADYFGINETAAQLILSLVVIMALVLPVMISSRGKNAPTIWIISAFLGECLVLALGWLPWWIMIMTIAVTVMSLATFSSKTIT